MADVIPLHRQGPVRLDVAERFLSFLAGSESVSFQTFDDSSQKRTPLSRIRHGNLNRYAEELTRLNQKGAGIYVMVNQGDCKGRTNANVRRIRAAFVDLDGSPLDPVLTAPLKPHVVIQSSPGKWHAYWFVDDVPLEKFKRMQRALAARFDSDPKVCDLARVMRLPGFYHRKADPFLVSIEQENHTQPYTFDELTSAFCLTPDIANQEVGLTTIGPNPEFIPEGKRNTTLISIGGGLRAEGKSKRDIEAVLLDLNHLQCKPPLSDDDVLAIAGCVARYSPDLRNQWRDWLRSEDGPPDSTTRHILLNLSMWMKADGKQCYPTIAILAQETAISERTIKKKLKEAASNGWLEIYTHKGRGQAWRNHGYLPKIPEDVVKEFHHLSLILNPLLKERGEPCAKGGDRRSPYT